MVCEIFSGSEFTGIPESCGEEEEEREKRNCKALKFSSKRNKVII